MENIKIIARSYEVNIEPYFEEEFAKIFSDDMIIFGGRAAGICYGPESYTDKEINNTEAAIKRANFNIKSGHHSVFEHGHVTMVIKTCKMVAMFLNSLGIYATSEKSARYTEMKPESELESKLYHKWIEKFESVISEQYSDIKTEKEIHKLALENARYLISVFTPTYMIYTISYNQAYMICHYIENLIADFMTFGSNFERANKLEIGKKRNSIIPFISKFTEELLELEKELTDKLGLLDENNELKIDNHKEQKSRFFDFYFDKPTNISDSYTINYTASLACLAQLQRHRTIKYFIDAADFYNLSSPMIYIPPIIDGTDLSIEWIDDAVSLVHSGIVIQGLCVNIREQATIEDFCLRSKERLCSRAQLETAKIVEQLTGVIAAESYNLSNSSLHQIQEYIGDHEILPRCACSSFKCKEPCKFGKNGLKRKI